MGGCGAYSDSGIDGDWRLAEPEGPDCGQRGLGRLHASVAYAWAFSRQPHGRALDRHRIWSRLRDQLRLLDDGLPGGSARAFSEQSAFGKDGADYWLDVQDGRATDRDCAWSAC